jgi:hypothetical protein
MAINDALMVKGRPGEHYDILIHLQNGIYVCNHFTLDVFLFLLIRGSITK